MCFAVGGRYVWPSAGVKSGRAEAVERSLFNDETAGSFEEN